MFRGCQEPGFGGPGAESCNVSRLRGGATCFGGSGTGGRAGFGSCGGLSPGEGALTRTAVETLTVPGGWSRVSGSGVEVLKQLPVGGPAPPEPVGRSLRGARGLAVVEAPPEPWGAPCKRGCADGGLGAGQCLSVTVLM